jgi:EmrB/QacA subfamily drug resistance transporter
VSTPATRQHYRVTYAVILLGVTAYSLLLSMVFPALPAIQRALHTSEATATWVLTIYLLSAAVCTPIVGRIGDKVGKNKMLVFATLMLAVGSILAGLSTNIATLLLARAVQGAGGGVLPLSFGIIKDEFPEERVGFAVGFVSAMLAVGAGAGTILAGPIVEHLGFHALFWIPLGMVLVAALLAWRFVPDSPSLMPGKINWFAALLLAVWLVCLLVPVSKAPSWGWGSPSVLGLLLVAVLVALWWMRVEWRSDHPLIDMRMMRAKPVWTNNLVAFLIGIGMYASGAVLPSFLQTPSSHGYGFGASITLSSVYQLPNIVTMFVFGLWSGHISERIGAKPTLLLGVTASTIGYGILATVPSSIVEVMVATGLLGTGFGLAFSAIAHLIVDAVPDNQTGAATGMNTNIRTIGGALGAAVVASIIGATLQASGYPTKAGYHLAFGFMALFTAFGLLASFFLPRPVHEHEHDAEHVFHAETAVIAGADLVD